MASKSAGTQTEFPAAMLEDYVVKNRKRILKLLGIVQPQGNGEFYERLRELMNSLLRPESRNLPHF